MLKHHVYTISAMLLSYSVRAVHTEMSASKSKFKFKIKSLFLNKKAKIRRLTQYFSFMQSIDGPIIVKYLIPCGMLPRGTLIIT